MNKDIFPQISTNEDNFFNDNRECFYYSQNSNDSNMNFEEKSHESILSLLIGTNKNSKENPEKNTSDESLSNRVNFVVEKKYINKKRGRKAKEKNKKKFHDKTQVDNLLRKIQTHFFTFVIFFCNDILRKEYPNYKDFFKNINYKNKRNVKYSYTSSLKKATIKDLLKMDISIKHKKCGSSYNKTLLEKIENYSPSLSKLFEMNYLELFEKYYNKGNPLNEIAYENIIINLSEETKSKTFFNLIDKDKNLKKHLIDITEKEYICNIKN